MFVRSGPMPGWVMMSMNSPPAKWFSAAKASRVMWIALIADLGGSRPPSKLSTRMTAFPPAMSCSCCAISSGSSDSASICSRVIAVAKVERRSDAASRASRETVTESCSPWIPSTATCLLSPALICRSFRRRDSKPGNSARIVYRPGASPVHAAIPLSLVVTGAISLPAAGVTVTLALGMTAPV
jgi:hypothetical protein